MQIHKIDGYKNLGGAELVRLFCGREVIRSSGKASNTTFTIYSDLVNGMCHECFHDLTSKDIEFDDTTAESEGRNP
jgi:hypothetical protein